MLDRIKELEKKARDLAPGATKRSAVTGAVLDYLESFLERMIHAPAIRHTEDNGKALYDSPITDKSVSIHTLLELLDKHVNSVGENLASGKHMAYMPGGGLYYSALGDYLAAATNCQSGVFFSSPGAVRMENMLLRWIAGVVGYPETASGNLTSGGSIAHIIAITTARKSAGLRAKDFHNTVVYLTKQAHHSVVKGLYIAGMEDCIKHFIPVDKHNRMLADAMNKAIIEDKKSGRIPFLIIATAGTTNTGAVDPLEDIASIARNHHLWYHLDGAYGAFFALCKEGRRILKGMEDSDSIILDPHKSLFLPFGSGAVLVRDAAMLVAANRFDAEYLQDAREVSEELSPADLSFELTRHFRGLRFWLPLKLLGTSPFEAALEEKLLLARYFYQSIRSMEGFETGPPPDLSIVTFRYVPKTGDADTFNKRLIHAIQKDGSFFLSSTILNDKLFIRLAVLNFRTHLDTLISLIEFIKQKSETLKKL